MDTRGTPNPSILSHPYTSINSGDGDVQDESLSSSKSTNRNVLIALPPFSSKPERTSSTAFLAKLSPYRGILVTAAYATVSMCAVVVNKSVMSSWNFNFPLTMLACQMIISFGLLCSLKYAGLIEYNSWSSATAIKVSPMVLAHVGNVLLGLAALNLVDIPMFGTLRRTAIVFVIVMEYYVLGKRSSSRVIASSMIMLVGALVAGSGDLHFDPFGYGLTFCVNITTGLTLVLIPKLSAEANLNAFGLMLYQITVSFPLIVAAIFLSGEYEGVAGFAFWGDSRFQFAFFLSCAQIFLVNYTLFLCTQLTSPLTTTVAGTVKNIGETILGFTFFNVSATATCLAGLALGFTGSVYYSYVKYLEQKTGSPLQPSDKAVTEDDSPRETDKPQRDR